MPYYRCSACGVTTHSIAAHSTAGVCASCAAPVPTDWVRSVGSGNAAPEQARRMVTGLPLQDGVRDDLVIVVSELVTNAVRHSELAAGDPIEVRVAEHDALVSVSVHDGGPGFSQPTTRTGSRHVGGNGLRIVAALSTDWNVENGPDGCTVQCVLERTDVE